MSEISKHPLENDATLAEKMKTATFEELKQHLADALVTSGHAQRDAYDSSILLPVENPTPTAHRYAQAIEIGGVKKLFEGDSELDVTRQVNTYMREQFSTATPEQARDASGRFTAHDTAAQAAQADEAEILRQSDLKLRLMRGEVSVDQAMGEYLQAQGLSVSELKRASEQSFASGWESATAQFQARHPDYVGGTDNLAEFSRTLQALNLVNNPSLSSLEAAFADMVRRNAYYENPEVTAYQEQQDRLANAKTPDEIREALGRGSSSLFGGR